MLKVRNDFDLKKLKYYDFYNTNGDVWVKKLVALQTEVEGEYKGCYILVNSRDFKNREVTINCQFDDASVSYIDDLYIFPKEVFDLIKNGIFIWEDLK